MAVREVERREDGRKIGRNEERKEAKKGKSISKCLNFKDIQDLSQPSGMVI